MKNDNDLPAGIVWVILLILLAVIPLLFQLGGFIKSLF